VTILHVDAVGLSGPGMADWNDGADVVTSRKPYRPDDVPTRGSALLPANERRRVSPTVRLALQVAEEAMARSSVDMAGICSVFATCDGDTEVIDRICNALTLPGRPVSPTQFHNSVHNAAAGYWAIAARSPMPSTTVCAYGASFAAGLMEAAAQLRVEARPVLLVAYDHTPPEPLAAAAGRFPSFAVAMVLRPQAGRGSRMLRVETASGQPVSGMESGDLERLRTSNPAAAALPLLRALAGGDAARVVLPHVNGLQLAVGVAAG
jgi:hypothetical protein